MSNIYYIREWQNQVKTSLQKQSYMVLKHIVYLHQHHVGTEYLLMNDCYVVNC